MVFSLLGPQKAILVVCRYGCPGKYERRIIIMTNVSPPTSSSGCQGNPRKNPPKNYRKAPKIPHGCCKKRPRPSCPLKKQKASPSRINCPVLPIDFNPFLTKIVCFHKKKWKQIQRFWNCIKMHFFTKFRPNIEGDKNCKNDPHFQVRVRTIFSRLFYFP